MSRWLQSRIENYDSRIKCICNKLKILEEEWIDFQITNIAPTGSDGVRGETGATGATGEDAPVVV